jgi:hypothetical protein
MFGITLFSLTVIEYDFMRSLGWRPLQVIDWPSGLALGPYGIWMTAMFILSGVLMAIFALGLRAALGTGPRLASGPWACSWRDALSRAWPFPPTRPSGRIPKPGTGCYTICSTSCSVFPY